MDNVQVLAEVIAKHTGFSPSGLHCKFIKIDDVWALKIYDNEYIRDKAYDSQKKVAESDLAPKVGIKFNLDYTFCYVTEIAETLFKGDTNEKWWREYHRVNSDMAVMEKIRKCVAEMWQKAEYDMGDIHPGNFGYLRDKMVCIDFSI